MNLEQGKQGLAWPYKVYEHEQPLKDREAPYAKAPKEAQEARRGLWRDSQPQPLRE